MYQRYSSMTDDSHIVLRWMINNATATLATGGVESEVFEEGGFRWAVAVRRGPRGNIVFSLLCPSVSTGPGDCEAAVSVHAHYRGPGIDRWVQENTFRFDANNFLWTYNSEQDWSWFNSSWFNINDKITLEFRIRIISSNSHITMFSAPNNMSNVILKIGDEKLHVSKELLSVHSAVFSVMFFGEFAEKGKDEVEIKDVVYKEFIDLLQLIYVRNVELTDSTVSHILKLADQFQIVHIVELCVKHLKQSREMDAVKKLLLADRYNLATVTNHCLQSFTMLSGLTGKIMVSPEFDNFSDDLKIAICDRIAKLATQS